MRGKITGFGQKAKYFIDEGGSRGWVEVSKDKFDEAFPPQPIVTGHVIGASVEWRKPIESDALAVHPIDIPQAEADAAKHGVPTQFIKEDGRPIFTSREHRRRYMRTINFHDRQGGYGD